MEEIQPGIYKESKSLWTRNQVERETVYGESLKNKDGVEYRNWQPSRSKAGAAVMKEVDLEIEQDSTVLYLGAASGTTVSHFSDILENGFIFGVEYSESVARKLVQLSEKRENIAPIVADARKTELYSDLVPGKVDVVFQDISQKDQPEIFLKNVDKFLKSGGVGLIAVKAHSISSTRPAEEVFQEVKDKLKEKMSIVGETTLEPYERKHLFLKLRK